jgi:hypothetical protein
MLYTILSLPTRLMKAVKSAIYNFSIRNNQKKLYAIERDTGSTYIYIKDMSIPRRKNDTHIQVVIKRTDAEGNTLIEYGFDSHYKNNVDVATEIDTMQQQLHLMKGIEEDRELEQDVIIPGLSKVKTKVVVGKSITMCFYKDGVYSEVPIVENNEEFIMLMLSRIDFLSELINKTGYISA